MVCACVILFLQFAYSELYYDNLQIVKRKIDQHFISYIVLIMTTNDYSNEVSTF